MLGHPLFRYVREEGYSIAEADQKWRSSLRDPAVRRETTDGVLKLAVEGHEAYVMERGTQKTHTVRQTATDMTASGATNRMNKKARRELPQEEDPAFRKAGAAFFRPGSASKSGGGQGRNKMSIFDDMVAETFDMASAASECEDDDLRLNDSVSNRNIDRRHGHSGRRRTRSPSSPRRTGSTDTPREEDVSSVTGGSSMARSSVARQSPRSSGAGAGALGGGHHNLWQIKPSELPARISFLGFLGVFLRGPNVPCAMAQYVGAPMFPTGLSPKHF